MKDPADYYNISVNLLVKRKPSITPTYPVETFEGKTLGQAIDKGFPYDDLDIKPNEYAKHPAEVTVKGKILGKMNG